MSYYPIAAAAKSPVARGKFIGCGSAALFSFGRVLGPIVLGTLVVLSPDLGSSHREVGWLLILGWAPLALVLDLWVAPPRRLPLQMAIDLFVIVACSAALPDLWFPALVLGALTVGGSVPRCAPGHKLLLFSDAFL